MWRCSVVMLCSSEEFLCHCPTTNGILFNQLLTIHTAICNMPIHRFSCLDPVMFVVLLAVLGSDLTLVYAGHISCAGIVPVGARTICYVNASILDNHCYVVEQVCIIVSDTHGKCMCVFMN